MTKQQFIKYFPKKKLSQNYLTDDNICRKIVDSFDVRKGDVVLEIGAGRGAITKYLQKQSHNLTAVELDRNNCAVLKEKFPELRILNEDFLKLDFAYLSTAYRSTQKIRVIGNIPYNITSPILFKLIENRELISDALLMMQEEVARRLAAKPGTKDYGITSVFSQIFAKTHLSFRVSRNCFYPKPKVDSRMVQFDFSNELEEKISNIGFFRSFVRSAFGKRRKMLRNALKDAGIETKKLNSDFDFSRRAESLTPEEFIELSNKFYRKESKTGYD